MNKANLEAVATKRFLREAQTGDLLAFQGTSLFSRAIRLKTRHPISHVGIVIRERHSRLSCLEAIDVGVVKSSLPGSVAGYDGAVFWLPLAPGPRTYLSEKRLIRFGMSKIGVPYDMKQAMRSAFDLFDGFCMDGFEIATHNHRDFSRLFCSELVAASLAAGCVISDDNPSELTPRDVCRMPLWSEAVRLTTGKEILTDFGRPNGMGT